ncbi:hypothetical protein A4A49_43114, partial [Nicotiana attenuata]
MHHEQDNTSANVLSSSPNTHVFVPSGQKQNVSAALISQQLLKDDKKELSPAAHQITKIPAGMKEIELSAGREKQQISGVTLISNTTMVQFSSTRVENVIKDTHLMTKHENKSTGKLKSKLDAPDLIPRKPPGGTCINNVVTSQNDGQEHIGTSKEGAIWMKNAATKRTGQQQQNFSNTQADTLVSYQYVATPAVAGQQKQIASTQQAVISTSN